MPSSSTPRPLAVLVGVQLPGVSDPEHAADLAELGRLVHTLGYEVAATVSQRRQGVASGTVLGSGKLQELARLTGGSGTVSSGAKSHRSKARERWEAEAEEASAAAPDVPPEAPLAGPETGEETGEELEEDAGEAPEADEGEEGDGEDGAEGGEDEGEDGGEAGEEEAGARPTVVVVDHELSPSQLSNLERATGAQVLDRTGVIVDIFHRHARSREARMQVEIARLNYLAPRMRESTGSRERQQGRGSGDSAVELDRRRIRDRLAELREGLAAIEQDQDQRRYARRDQLRVALVGYTNAGKSSLMRALTGSEVLVADRLFATLDTTVRALQPETRPRVLVSDTVGFIQKLPHDLVASFRSTLDEALEASLLLYVVDGSDATWASQLEVTRTVLREIGADAVPSQLVFNKADRLTAEERAVLVDRHPEAWVLSAHVAEDVAGLRARIIEFFERSMVEAELVIPYARQGKIGEVYEHARVLAEEYDETGRRMKIRALPAAVARLTHSFGG